MINRIREVRRAHGLTLKQVATRCNPATTAQTIGRLETGHRTLSLDWLERIATALNVDSQQLISHGGKQAMPLVATIGCDYVKAGNDKKICPLPQPSPNMVAVQFAENLSEYNSGDLLWMRKIDSDQFIDALNSDILLPRSGARLFFGRLLHMDHEKLHIMPLKPGQRQVVVPYPEWIAKVDCLIRRF